MAILKKVSVSSVSSQKSRSDSSNTPSPTIERKAVQEAPASPASSLLSQQIKKLDTLENPSGEYLSEDEEDTVDNS